MASFDLRRCQVMMSSILDSLVSKNNRVKLQIDNT